MDEDATYRKLTRIPLDEMEALLDISNFRSLSTPIRAWGEHTYEAGIYWKRDLEIHRWRVKTMKQNGWTFDEFFLEIEKRNIQRVVDDYNMKNSVPGDLMARIKEFYPNAKLVPAKLELE